MSFTALLALLAAGSAAPLPAQLQLDGRDIRAGDIATGVPSEPVVARIPNGEVTVELSEAVRRRLIVNRFPGVAFSLRESGALLVRARRPNPPVKAKCLRSTHAIAAGQHLTNADAEPIPCDPTQPKATLRFDRQLGAVIAADPVAAGEILGAVRLASTAFVPAGTGMHYRTAEGPVTIEREVVTLQPGRAGRSVFARTIDGQVISAPLEKREGEQVP